MKNRIALVLLLVCSNVACAAESLTTGTWKIESYKMSGRVGAWSDNEAKALLRKTLTANAKGITVGGKFCAGKVSKLGAAGKSDLTSDLKGEFCNKGRVTGDVYDIDLSCKDAVQFTPYAVGLSNGKYLAFGDGITFCLAR